MGRVLYSSGEKRAYFPKYYECIEFTEVYQTNHCHMGIQINYKHLPKVWDGGWSGGGNPPEYYSGGCIGLFNLDANPTTEWFDIKKENFRQQGFLVIDPRPYHHKFVWEAYESSEEYFDKKEVLTTEVAMARIQDLCTAYFKPIYEREVMKIRKRKQEERIDALRRYKEEIPKTLKRLKDRIAKGTSVPEVWEWQIH